MMSTAMKQMIENAWVKNKLVEGFDKSFNSGYSWAVESYDNINVTMIKTYYVESRMICAWDDDDDYSYIELCSETDARMLKRFVPRKLWCESGDYSDIYAIGFMRGVVAGVEHRAVIAECREQYHWGIRKYADMVSYVHVDSCADDVAPLKKTATETSKFEGRGSQPPALQ
jgi:hypothetical protein